ncbi:MAG: hypothetical protein M3Y35_10240 [Actinomycetota bacterium]|nr:hypothetical protein [Actinomycetota bacterium]
MVEKEPCRRTTGRFADRQLGRLTPGRPTSGSATVAVVVAVAVGLAGGVTVVVVVVAVVVGPTGGVPGAVVTGSFESVDSPRIELAAPEPIEIGLADALADAAADIAEVAGKSNDDVDGWSGVGESSKGDVDAGDPVGRLVGDPDGRLEQPAVTSRATASTAPANRRFMAPTVAVRPGRPVRQRDHRGPVELVRQPARNGKRCTLDR